MYRKEIISAHNYLKRVQNPDNGIPATMPGAVSGCWTTGEALEAILSSPFCDVGQSDFIRKLIQFIIESQFKAGINKGSWPLVIGGSRGSTMATGHNVASLIFAKDFFSYDSTLVNSMEEKIAIGFEWLERNNNSDGGWGVEPTGGTDGKTSRMISTVYALKAYFRQGKTVEDSRTVRNGITWIISAKNSDGGFGGKEKSESDSCNTARAINAIIQSYRYDMKNPIIKNAIRYIYQAKPHNKLWPLDTETYVTEGAPGQTIYNSNTTADILEVLLRVNKNDKNVVNLINWFIKNQEDDGSWRLGANDHFVNEITTWSTNEAIYAMSYASKISSDKFIPNITKKFKYWRRISFALGLIVIAECVLLINFPLIVKGFWLTLPVTFRTILTQTILIALVVNLLAAILFEKIKPLFKNR